MPYHLAFLLYILRYISALVVTHPVLILHSFLLNQLVFSLEEVYKLHAAYTFIFAAEKEPDFCGI